MSNVLNCTGTKEFISPINSTTYILNVVVTKCLKSIKPE